MFDRFYNIAKLISKKRVLMIYGPRRVGKTTLVKEFLKNTHLKYKLDSGDNIKTQLLFEQMDFETIQDYIQGYQLLVIDEAQQIKNIGRTLKIIIDEFPMYIIVTGSSSFEISHQTGEPLTGRKKTLLLFPLSVLELKKYYNTYEMKSQLSEWLIFGMYPEVLSAKTKKEKAHILKELVDSYLLKDVFALERIKAPANLLELLKLLAYQIGSEVSLNELAMHTRMDVKTVARYLDLLEKSYVIKKITGFSRNKRNEIVNKAKYYFIDIGIRNAIINQFNNLNYRNDTGALFENFIMMEKYKKIVYTGNLSELYFWRTHQQKEIDMIEVKGKQIYGYEIKWNNNTSKKTKNSNIHSFKQEYKTAKVSIINSENFLNVIS